MEEVWPETSPEAPEAGLKARILIVDDDERNAFAAAEALKELGHELVITRSGEEALKRLLTEEFSVILLDVHMPGMDGYEAAALIRGRRRTRHIPIVFLTAVSRDEAHLFQAYSAGAVDVVYKPVDPFILRSKVSVLVELHLKTQEISRQLQHRQKLLDENARVSAEKAVAEKALARARERQEAIINALPIVFTAREAEHPFRALYVSDSVEALTGFSPRCFTDTPEFGLEGVHPDDVAAVVQALTHAKLTGRYICEYRWKCANGAYRVLLDQGVIAHAPDGEPIEIFGTIEDVTERRGIEQQLRHAQKMEAVGQLTGGVAHDFNNLLTVVLGNIDILQRRGGLGETQERQLAAVREAAERGRNLTRQLLAFSRRQHLRPAPVDVSELTHRFSDLLQQAVGESVTLTVEAFEPAWTNVDPTQLETAILNLAVNARDAMPAGGELTVRVSSRDTAEGRRVVIEVVDEGVGMEADVAEKVFEPFFTTKEVGKGSGLGLSQVYGFVRQSGGHVEIDTAPGKGATFRLYLPTGEAGAPRIEEEARAAVAGGSEHVLVVEDDETVLSVALETLTALGYRVTTATSAADALQAFRQDASIDLVFSDVVMPGGSSGVDLAHEIRSLRPDVGILLTSGYLGHRAAPTNAFALIDKPYEPSTLAARVREVLSLAREPKAKARARARRAAHAGG